FIMTDGVGNDFVVSHGDYPFGNLPDHLLIDIFIRIPVGEWIQLACVRKQWANLFRGECLWQAALHATYPSSGLAKRWPGPIPQGLSKRFDSFTISVPLSESNVVSHLECSLCLRRYTALHVSKRIFGKVDEIVGHTYLFLKEQLERSTTPSPSSILHGTIIDQFIACGKSTDTAHELASQIWLAVLDNLEENERTFQLLKCLAHEWDVFLPYPYTKSIEVQWRVFEKLFTDFRDCLDPSEYYEALACAKNKFQPIPSTWLGY
ncbi:hypothetical protein LINGRAHAP2_LOCUS2683, partial [Linum grandiflorum]